MSGCSYCRRAKGKGTLLRRSARVSRLAHDRETSPPVFLVSVLARFIQLNDTTSYEEAVRILLDEQNGERPYYVGPAEVA